MKFNLLNINNYKKPPKTYKELINKYKPTEGLFCGVQFNKCKSFPMIQNKIFWVTLPINASEWKMITITDKNGKILEEKRPVYAFSDLDSRENLILSETKKTFSAKDAEDIIKKKRGTVLKYLKNLCEKGYIRKEGTKKSTYYVKTINDNISSENDKKIITTTNSSNTPCIINREVQNKKYKQTHDNNDVIVVRKKQII